MNEKKKGFDLGSTLADVLGTVPNSDTREKLEYIAIDKLDEDVENFYSMEGIDELAANIELIGLQQPLRVRENPKAPGHYLIVSGHRRRKALGILYAEAPERWGSVPCIVEAGGSDALNELRLIYANADTRRMSSFDLAKQAERVTALLYELKEQGYDFPGRMRDHVAEACKVSKTKLATLKVIREKLIPELRQLWEAGDLNETCAYKIAQQPEADQIRLTEIKTLGWFNNIYEWHIERSFDVMRAVDAGCCPDGTPCKIKAERQTCDSRPSCCLNCWRKANCEHACERAKAKVAEIRAREAEQEKLRAEEQAKREAEREQEAADARAAWERVRRAAMAAGVGAREIAAVWLEEEADELDDEDVLRVIRHMDGSNTDRFESTIFPYEEYECDELSTLASLLHCSTDYLLGRTEEIAPAAASTAVPQFCSGTPTEKTLAWCAFTIEGREITTAAVWWPHLGKWCFEHGASIDAECVGWYPLPDWRGVLRDDEP